MLTHEPSGRRKTRSMEGFFLDAISRPGTGTLWFKWHKNTERPISDTNETGLVYVCGKKGSYFTTLAIQEWFIFQMKTDWRHKHRQAHATWMLLNGLLLAGWCEVGMIHRAAIVMWWAVLCCDRAAIMLTAWEMLVVNRSALNSPHNGVWKGPFYLMQKKG